MIRTTNPGLAREMAAERGQSFGLSVFPHADGRAAWLVGTPAELLRAGIVEIQGERRRSDHCTHPKQEWCDCDWCRVNGHWHKQTA